jgi:hypothetical protein
MKSIFFTLFIATFSVALSSAQSKEKIYILVDTIHMQPESKLLEIGQEGSFICYQFYCTCVSPYDRNLTFAYDLSKAANKTLKIKPTFKFTSWREFQELFSKMGYDLEIKYDIYISELLPRQRYRTNKVFMVKFSREIVQ